MLTQKFSPQWSDWQSEYPALASWSGTPVSEAVHRARSADLIFGGGGPPRSDAFHPTALAYLSSLVMMRTCLY